MPGSGILIATSRLGVGTSTGGSTLKAGGTVHVGGGSGGGGVAPPPSAWAKPDVQVTRDAAGGEVSAMLLKTIEAAERILQEIERGRGWRF